MIFQRIKDIPEGRTAVSLSANIIFDTKFPSSVTSITFDAYFNKPLVTNVFPQNLLHLDLGWYFDQNISDDVLPESLETIKFGYWFNKPILLTKRNLTLIDVTNSYGHSVSPDILHIMCDTYRKNYSTIVKNHTVRPEDCKSLPSTLSLSSTKVPDTSLICVDDTIDTLPDILASVENEVDKFFMENTNFVLDTKSIYVKDEGNIVIELKYSYWNNNMVIFIMDKQRDIYRTYWKHIYIPKPYQWHTNNDIIGPFSLTKLSDYIPD